MSKKAKRLLAAGLAALLLAALVGGGIALRRKRRYEQAVAAAQELFAAGDYAAARDAYAALGLESEAASSSEALALRQKREKLAEAERLLAEGDFLAARELFASLGAFENAAARVRDCDLGRAAALLEAECWDEGFALLGQYPDDEEAAALLARGKERLYALALEATYACRMDEAIALWEQLGDYRDARALCRRCRMRLETVAAGTDEPVRYSPYAGEDLGSGTLYWHRIGLIYVPKDAGPETRCMIFYPGGYDESLANAYLSEYVREPDPPNAIMVLCYANGFYDMPAKIEDSCRVLEQAAIENNVFVHDLVLCGASNGAYTACLGAAQLWEDYGLPVSAVMTFDAGMHWGIENHTLTPDQCDLAAEAGTRFLLLENGGIGMNKRAIELMVAHDCDVTIVECAAGGHYGIIYDAIEYGMIDWALGKGERPENRNYRYIPLDRTSTYPFGA